MMSMATQALDIASIAVDQDQSEINSICQTYKRGGSTQPASPDDKLRKVLSPRVTRRLCVLLKECMRTLNWKSKVDDAPMTHP